MEKGSQPEGLHEEATTELRGAGRRDRAARRNTDGARVGGGPSFDCSGVEAGSNESFWEHHGEAALTEARMEDAAGRLYAVATSTCLILDGEAGG